MEERLRKSDPMRGMQAEGCEQKVGWGDLLGVGWKKRAVKRGLGEKGCEEG